jgi:hypothetical protein
MCRIACKSASSSLFSLHSYREDARTAICTLPVINLGKHEQTVLFSLTHMLNYRDTCLTRPVNIRTVPYLSAKLCSCPFANSCDGASRIAEVGHVLSVLPEPNALAVVPQQHLEPPTRNRQSQRYSLSIPNSPHSALHCRPRHLPPDQVLPPDKLEALRYMGIFNYKPCDSVP